MPASKEEIERILTSPDWTDGEKAVVMWQYRLHGDFHTALFNAIKTADQHNLARLERGFPDEVSGFRAWAWGDLGKRLRAAGLSICG